MRGRFAAENKTEGRIGAGGTEYSMHTEGVVGIIIKSYSHFLDYIL